MCGIVGLYSFAGPAPHRALWPALVNHLAHRGPDDGGWWADGPFFLGHRRLSIVGLASGGQPMATADGGLVVTFNGEIYNYPELRAELEADGYLFRTDCDTEVLLHGYRAWGEGLPARLTGMFAFALADRRRNELFLARDRLGEKPLFVYHVGRYVAFASELRPLAALPDRPRRLDPEALGGYLLLNYVPGEACLLEGVRRLPAASWCRLGPDGERRGRYWEPPTATAQAPPLADALDECQRRLDRAVRLNLRSDVPVGIFLSSGIDSALVAESAVRQGRLNRAYCLDFAETTHSEYDAARALATRLGLECDRVVLTEDALGEFLLLVEHADDPLADSSALAVWTIARHAARVNKVVLGGDGGDEMFGGYLTYRATRLHGRLARRVPPGLLRAVGRAGRWLPTGEGKVSFSYKLRRFLRGLHLPGGEAHFSWNGTWMPEEAACLVRPGPAREAAAQGLATLAARHGLGARPALFELQRADALEYLPNDILAKTDRMSMAHGLEIRAPFLEPELASWALALPEGLKIGPGGQLKYLLRALARRVIGPAVADRPKQGFSIPVHAWLRGRFAEVLRDLLAPASVERLGLLEPAPIQRLLGEHLAGRCSLGFELWGLAVLVAWHRARVERQPAAPTAAALREVRVPAAPGRAA
jgi:asparagine synthase (glutamine-hydrolysing)